MWRNPAITWKQYLAALAYQRLRPGEPLTGDSKRLRTGPPDIPLDTTQFMHSLGQAPVKHPLPHPKLNYTHPSTDKTYLRAVFVAAATAHNGCTTPCYAKWIDPTSPCPMEGQPGHCDGDPSHSVLRQWDASQAIMNTLPCGHSSKKALKLQEHKRMVALTLEKKEAGNKAREEEDLQKRMQRRQRKVEEDNFRAMAMRWENNRGEARCAPALSILRC